MARGNYGNQPVPSRRDGLPTQAHLESMRKTRQFTDVDVDPRSTGAIPARRSASSTRTLPATQPIQPREPDIFSGTVIGRATRRPLPEPLPEPDEDDASDPDLDLSPVRNFSRKTTNILICTWQSPAIKKHHSWLRPFTISAITAIFCILVLLSAAMFQRAREPQYVNQFNGKVYDVQVGGNLASSWQNDHPAEIPTTVPTQTNGVYSVLGSPSVTPDFINRVLDSYQSPAAGKGQVLYDLGVQYGIDPVYALAFFMHESTFGTQGIARETHSLGNLRCIPNHKCERDFAWFDSWDDGFKSWYELICNLYVAQWERATVDPYDS